MDHVLGILHDSCPLVHLNGTQLLSVHEPQKYQWHGTIHWHVCVGAKAFEIFGTNGVGVVLVGISLENGLDICGVVWFRFLEAMGQREISWNERRVDVQEMEVLTLVCGWRNWVRRDRQDDGS